MMLLINEERQERLARLALGTARLCRLQLVCTLALGTARLCRCSLCAPYEKAETSAVITRERDAKALLGAAACEA